MDFKDLQYIAESYSRILSENSVTLDDLRRASAAATLAGPSRQAQNLMSARTKELLGPEKLKAGIEAQDEVERLKSGRPPAPAAQPTAQPTAEPQRSPEPPAEPQRSPAPAAAGAPAAGSGSSVEPQRPTAPAASTEPIRVSDDDMLQSVLVYNNEYRPKFEEPNFVGRLQRLDPRNKYIFDTIACKNKDQERLRKLGYTVQCPTQESFIVGYLIDEGYASSEKEAILISNHMSSQWKNHIIEQSNSASSLGGSVQLSKPTPNRSTSYTTQELDDSTPNIKRPTNGPIPYFTKWGPGRLYTTFPGRAGGGHLGHFGDQIRDFTSTTTGGGYVPWSQPVQ